MIHLADLFTGMLFVLSGFCLIIRQILLSPKLPKWPNANPWVRSAMFAFLVVCIFRGAEMMGAASDLRVEGHASPLGVLFAAALLLYQAAMTVNLLGHTLPARLWTRINAFTARMKCPPCATPAARL